jgi:hypothetical protein
VLDVFWGERVGVGKWEMKKELKVALKDKFK